MWTYTSTDELKHYGVLGMKWGVRRYQNKDGTRTAAGKNRYTESPTRQETKSDNSDDTGKKKLSTNQKIAIGAAVSAGILLVLGGVYMHKLTKPMPSIKTMRFGVKIDIDSLSKEETVLKNGTKFFRMSSKPAEEYVKDGRTYVSHLTKDRHKYRAEMPNYFKQWADKGIIDDDGKRAYEHIMRSNKPIKIPSKRTMAEVYMKVTESDHIDDGQYKRFMQNLNNKKNPDSGDFFNRIRKLGYNAVVDENDAGYLSKSPLILLNPKDDMSLGKVSKLKTIGKVLSVIRM